MAVPSSRPTRPSRIPLALQAVFLASNRGEDVHVPPTEANKTFVRKNPGDKPRFWQRLFGRRKKKNDRKNKLKQAETVDHTDSTSSEEPAPVHVTREASTASSPASPPMESSPPRPPSLPSIALPDSSPDSARVKKAQRSMTAVSSRGFYQTRSIPKQSGVELDETSPDSKSQQSTEDDGSCQQNIDISPQMFLDNLLRSRGYSTARFPSLQTAYSNPPTELQQVSHTEYMVSAVRANALSSIRAVLKAGLSPNPCNTRGESILHLTARSSPDASLLKLLLEYGATVQCVDDFGRSPLHDACWRTTPCFDIVSIILEHDARLMHVVDSRSATPLSYVPRSQWSAWCDYLEQVQDIFWPVRTESATQPFPALVLQKPGTRPLPDPAHIALPIKVATLLAQGRLTPKEARWLVDDDIHGDSSSDDSESNPGDCNDSCMDSSLSSEDSDEDDYEDCFQDIPRFVQLVHDV